MRRLSCLMIACTLLCPLQAAEVFKWTDPSGRVHYSDRPPPSNAREIERRKATDSFNMQTVNEMPYAVRQAAQKHPVTLFSFDICGDPCKQAEALLNHRGVPYTLKNREEDKEVLKQLTGDNQVPVLVVGRQPPLKGFESGAWHHLLDLAGYPRSNPLAGLRNPKPAIPPSDTTAAPSPNAP